MQQKCFNFSAQTDLFSTVAAVPVPAVPPKTDATHCSADSKASDHHSQCVLRNRGAVSVKRQKHPDLRSASAAPEITTVPVEPVKSAFAFLPIAPGEPLTAEPPFSIAQDHCAALKKR